MIDIAIIIMIAVAPRRTVSVRSRNVSSAQLAQNGRLELIFA